MTSFGFPGFKSQLIFLLDSLWCELDFSWFFLMQYYIFVAIIVLVEKKKFFVHLWVRDKCNKMDLVNCFSFSYILHTSLDADEAIKTLWQSVHLFSPLNHSVDRISSFCRKSWNSTWFTYQFTFFYLYLLCWSFTKIRLRSC